MSSATLRSTGRSSTISASKRWRTGYATVLVTLAPIEVMYVSSARGLSGVGDAWTHLETAVGTRRGRKFYGTFLQGEYRACVALKPSDDPDALGLGRTVIPGGAYAASKVRDWTRGPDAIRTAILALRHTHQTDDSRPDIEFYRSETDMLVYVPVMDAE